MDEEMGAVAGLPTQMRIIRRRKRTKAGVSVDHTSRVGFSRRHSWQHQVPHAPPIASRFFCTLVGRFVDEITAEELTQVMSMPAHQAALTTGVSHTAFKKLCRKFCLERWPYRKLKATGLLNPLPPQLQLLQAPQEQLPPSGFFLLPCAADNNGQQLLPPMPAMPTTIHLAAPSERQEQPDSRAAAAGSAAVHSSASEQDSPQHGSGAAAPRDACLGICSGLACLAEAAQAMPRQTGGRGRACCQAVAAAASPAPSAAPLAVERHPPARAAALLRSRSSIASAACWRALWR